MQKKQRSFIFILLILFMSSVSATDLNEVKVKEVLKKMDTASKQRDAEIVGSFLSNDINIIIHVVGREGKQVFQLTKQQYISSLKQAWQDYETLDYEISNLVIKINNNKATLNMDMLETVISNGEKISANSRQESVLELIGGKLLFTSFFAYSSIQHSPVMKVRYVKKIIVMSYLRYYRSRF